MGNFFKRQEIGADYTIPSDLTAAIERISTDRAGACQALARQIIELEGLVIEREYSTTWRTPAHRGMEGNEVVDSYA